MANPIELTDGTTKATVDPYLGALKVIDASHSQTHLGFMYSAGHRWTGQADNATLYLAIIVPAGYVAHMTYEVAATGKLYIDLYEGATVANGTAIVPANKNRKSENTTSIVVKRDVTVSDAGTLLPQDGLLGGGGKHTPLGGGSGLDAEWILDEATTYLLAVQNKGGAGQDIAAAIMFYEKEV